MYDGDQLPSKPYLVAKAGLARTFQNIRLFPNMTALENVMVGRHVRMQQGILSAIGRGPRYQAGERGGQGQGRTSCWPSSGWPSTPATWPGT